MQCYCMNQTTKHFSLQIFKSYGLINTFQESVSRLLAASAPESDPHNYSTPFIADNFLKVEVFYEDLNSEKILEKPKYLVSPATVL